MSMSGIEKEHREHLAELKKQVKVVPVATAKRVGGKNRPGSGSKTVHFIRHGQGYHNLFTDVLRDLGHEFSGAGLPEEKNFNPYKLPEMVDPHLTELGREQARALNAKYGKTKPELIVSSPLSRAISTGQIAFQHQVGKVPFILHEAVREQSGVHRCDQRRERKHLALDYPFADMDLVTDGRDAFFSMSERESKHSVAERGIRFLKWLRERPEREIVVASHSSWLLTMFNCCLDCGGDEALLMWFGTGELRSVDIEFT